MHMNLLGSLHIEDVTSENTVHMPASNSVIRSAAIFVQLHAHPRSVLLWVWQPKLEFSIWIPSKYIHDSFCVYIVFVYVFADM